MPVLGAIGWMAAVAGLACPGWLAWTLFGITAATLIPGRGTPLRLGALVVAATLLLVAQLHLAQVRRSPVAELATREAAVVSDLVVRSQPVVKRGRYGDFVRFEATTRTVNGRGRHLRARVRVLVIVDGETEPSVGSRLRVRGRLHVADDPQIAAVLRTRAPPEQLAAPGWLPALSNRTREAVRDATAELGPGSAALVPALVDGDEGAGQGTGAFAPAFQTSGMTHLLAVSGTNLTLILGALLAVALRLGVRAWGLAAVGLAGVVGFLLLAGPEPSVLRAAAMGSVALAGLGRAGRARGMHALGTAILVLLLIDPWLARSLGFLLSVTATAGILVLAPPWRDALARWLPRWVAEAIAVPLAAQVACTPVVAAISGQVSLVAVAANIVAAPLVGPATVFGLLAGLVALVSVPLSHLVALPAGWCAAAIIAIAERAAAMPVAAFPWPTTPVAVALLGVGCIGVALLLGPVLARRGVSIALAVVLGVLVRAPAPITGWPPEGWVMVACDVGQGDALVVRAGERSAVVVDAGPDAGLVDSCLRRLEVRSVPVLVISHFHADHVDGIDGVIRGRRVGRIDVSPLAEPESGAREVRDAATAARVPMRIVTLGERTRIGGLSWQVLGPVRSRPPDSGSPPNDASVVLHVETRGARLLLLGDQERPAQSDLRRHWPGLSADVLKVSHHGSKNQDADLIRGLGARVAMVSAGRDNDYGHPAIRTLDLLTAARMRVLRTDRDGDLAVVVRADGSLATATRGRRP